MYSYNKLFNVLINKIEVSKRDLKDLINLFLRFTLI